MNITLLKDIITKLANGEPLGARHKDHPLSGDWIGHRECHIQPDWLLVYRIENDILVPHSLPIAFTIEAGDFLVLVKSHIPYITALVFQDLSMPSGFLPFSDPESAG